MSIKTVLAASIPLCVSLCVAGAAMAQVPPAGPQDGGARRGHAVTKAEFMAKAHETFSRLDANHDGKVTSEELGEVRAARRTEMRAKAFERLDTNHDGAISRDEFNASGQHHEVAPRAGGPRGHAMGRGAGDFLRRFDANGDGAVTEAEYMGRVEEQFRTMDHNGDGTITRDEHPARHGRGHGREDSAPPASGQKDNGERGS